jgi:hypothetical protein
LRGEYETPGGNSSGGLWGHPSLVGIGDYRATNPVT